MDDLIKRVADARQYYDRRCAYLMHGANQIDHLEYLRCCDMRDLLEDVMWQARHPWEREP